MEKNFRGVAFDYHVNAARGIIKASSPNITGTNILDENNRYVASAYYQYNVPTADLEFEIYREFIDTVIREHFR
jgi:hypothetical protein